MAPRLVIAPPLRGLARTVALAAAIALALCARSGRAAAQVFRPRGKVASVVPNTTKAAPVALVATSAAAAPVASHEAATTPRVAPKAKPVAKATKRHKSRPAVARKHKRPKASDDVEITEDDDDVKIDDE